MAGSRKSARILRAVELLAAPRASVSATAIAVGFQSVAAFTTAFSELTGETPSDHRARMTMEPSSVSRGAEPT